MAQRRQVRVSRSLEGGGERPARGFGEPEAGAAESIQDRLKPVLHDGTGQPRAGAGTLVVRSRELGPSGETGRRTGLKIPWRAISVRVRSPPRPLDRFAGIDPGAGREYLPHHGCIADRPPDPRARDARAGSGIGHGCRVAAVARRTALHGRPDRRVCRGRALAAVGGPRRRAACDAAGAGGSDRAARRGRDGGRTLTLPAVASGGAAH